MTATLITGADGYVGQAVARWMLDHDDRALVLFVRADSEAERTDKLKSLGGLATTNRCEIVFGNLRDPEPFAEIDAAHVNAILHCAAVTNFGVDKDTANAVNVEGTAKLIDFAQSCPDLRRLGLVSSIYAVGQQEGSIEECPVNGSPDFANHYEWSKWSAEALVEENTDLPWQIYRVATILGEDNSGRVVQQNVIHNTLRLLFYGLMSVIPGNPDTRVYTVSGEYVADAIGRLLDGDEDQVVFHISDSGASAVTLAELTDLVYDVFMEDPGFARQRILKPRFCDRESFNILAETTGQLGGAVGQALASVTPFAPQLYSDKDVQTHRTQAALGGQAINDPSELVRAVSKHLVATRWGLKEAL